MANFAVELKRLGLQGEDTRGTVETTPTVFHAVLPSTEFNYSLELLMDNTVRGVMSEYPPAPGLKSGTGKINMPVRAQNIGEYLQMLIGNPTSTEETTAVITLNTNDYIDFTEDGGAEVSAQLTAGSYAYGTASSQAGTLCALIKTQMEAVNGASTYTVTYSYSTKKFTITKNTGVFVIKFLTGTNTAKNAAALLGFTVADTSSAIAATSNSTSGQWGFLHTFTPGSTLTLPTYTFFYDRSLNVLKYNMGSVSRIKLSASPDNFIMAEVDVMFKTEASGSIGSPSYTESEELTFQHVDFKIAGSSNTEVKQWGIEMSNGLLAKRTMSGSQDVVDFVATKNSINGDFVIYFANTTERDKFVAGTTTSIEMIATGDTIQNTIKYTVQVYVDDARYTAFPYDTEDGLLAAKVSWKGFYYNTNSRLYRARITNIYSTYTIS